MEDDVKKKYILSILYQIFNFLKRILTTLLLIIKQNVVKGLQQIFS